MNKNISIGVLIIAALAMFFWLLPQPEPAHGSAFIIANVKLFNGNKSVENMSVKVEKGRIVGVASKFPGEELDIIDGKGKTLVPGLIDAHTHSWGNALIQAVKFGVTTEMDMFTSHEFAATQRSRNGQLSGTLQADLFSAGTLVTAPGGHGTEYGIDIPTIVNPAQAEAFVAARLAEGSDYIKIVYNAKEAKRQDFPSINREVLTAVVRVTKEKNKLAVVHISNMISAEHAVQAGADGLVHTFMDATVTDELIAAMQEGNVFVIPTLSVLASMVGDTDPAALAYDSAIKDRLTGATTAALNSRFPDFGIPASAFETALENTRRMHAAGITILAGTDAPNPGTAHGVSLHGELELLVRAGLNNEEALHAATGAIADVFRLQDRGYIGAGKIADLVLLEGDPLQDIAATRRIVEVWKTGRRLSASDAIVEPAIQEVPGNGLLADFSNGTLDVNFGRGFEATTDQLMNGKSEAEIRWLNTGTNQGGALEITGVVKKGFSFPWSGVYFVAVQNDNEMLDLEQQSSIRFKARGTAGNYRLMLFSHGGGRPSETVFEVNETWTWVSIPLHKIQGVDLHRITGIAWVNGAQVDKFELVLDDISIQ